MRIRRVWVVLIVGVLTASCGTDPSSVEQVSVTGTWSGVIDGLEARLTLTLVENPDRLVTGEGTMQITAGIVPVEVQSGSHSFPDLTLTLVSSGLASFTYTGRVSRNGIAGRVEGSGFTGESLILLRQ